MERVANLEIQSVVACSSANLLTVCAVFTVNCELTPKGVVIKRIIPKLVQKVIVSAWEDCGVSKLKAGFDSHVDVIVLFLRSRPIVGLVCIPVMYNVSFISLFLKKKNFQASKVEVQVFFNFFLAKISRPFHFGWFDALE
jgi:hypothetical protein